MHQNIAGLLNKTDALNVCLTELSDKSINVDVLCITEHFMMSGYENHLIIPNYCLASFFCRIASKRGGACILIRNGHQWQEVPQIAALSVSGVVECCGVELTQYNIIVLCVYRVPKLNNLNVFYETLEKILHNLCRKKYKHIVIAGDFNIDILKTNKITEEFQCLLLNFNLKLAIKQPTRLQSESCIDNFAHNFNAKCKTEIIEFALSDHTAQILKCPVKKTCILKYWSIKRRDYSTDNMIKFKECLKKLTFSDIYETDDPNNAYNIFIDIFKLFYNLCFPFKLTTINVIKKPKWISKGVKLCSKKKRKLLWRYRLEPNLANKTTFINYTKRLKKIMKLTRRAQNNYSIKTSSNTSKTTWRIINDSKPNLPKEFINSINVDNKIINNPVDIANSFNNFFVDKVQPILSSDSNMKPRILNRKDSIFVAPSIPMDIQKIIKSLKSTNSVGYDGISTRIIKYVSELISGHLSYIINLCISSGVYPDALKVSVIKPLFKKNSKEHMANYRPISLIPIISKIFEKYIYKELYRYIEKNHILCDEQKGFRENRTINMAIYEFLHRVMMNMDKRIPVSAIFCDMTQAFDYVNHSDLLRKLEAYGIRGNILNLIQSYLSNRRQYTEITKINIMKKREEVYSSNERSPLYGVPQGSVLGPLLFILYINDLPRATSQPMTLFADDSTVTITCKNKDIYEYDINQSLTSIISWLNENNLKINLDKTIVMHFSQRPQTGSVIKVLYNNTLLDEVDSTKFLGIMIDTKLNWKAHIEYLSKRLSSSAYALYKLAPELNPDALLTAYHGIVASVLRYGIIFWGNSTDKDIAFKAQKRCIRAMFNLKSTDSCMPFFKKYKILTLPSLYILETVAYVKTNPELFPRLADTVNRNRRDNSKLRLHSAKTTLMRKSIFCMAPIIYNNIPQAYRELNTNLLKKKMRNLLTDKCYYDINDFLTDII